MREEAPRCGKKRSSEEWHEMEHRRQCEDEREKRRREREERRSLGESDFTSSTPFSWESEDDGRGWVSEDDYSLRGGELASHCRQKCRAEVQSGGLHREAEVRCRSWNAHARERPGCGVCLKMRDMGRDEMAGCEAFSVEVKAKEQAEQREKEKKRWRD